MGIIRWDGIVSQLFVVGFYSMITFRNKRNRCKRCLASVQNYMRKLYLQKSMDHIEQITAASHELYRKLKKKNLHELSVQALLITQEIHEVKKDSQRILSGII